MEHRYQSYYSKVKGKMCFNCKKYGNLFPGMYEANKLINATDAIGGSGGGGGAYRAHAPLWDPIISFLHTFSLKSTSVGGPCPPLPCRTKFFHFCTHFQQKVPRVRGPHPPNGSTPPPTGNPGSATVLYHETNQYNPKEFVLRLCFSCFYCNSA